MDNRTSKLTSQIQSLMRLIFDIDSMNEFMMEMKIDPKKMPLGLLSPELIQQGYKILTAIQELLESNGNKDFLVSHTNQFYTLIPQDFGGRRPPLIDSTEMVKEKTILLQTLEEIEIAKSLLTNSDKTNPIDESYEKLNCEISPIGSDTEEYEMIETFVNQTQSSRPFRLTLKELFTVSMEYLIESST